MQIKKYKRLTHYNGPNAVVYDYTEMSGEIAPIITRLAKLEDRIESGVLIWSPCKLGEKIYVVNPKRDEVFECRVTKVYFYLNETGIHVDKLRCVNQFGTKETFSMHDFFANGTTGIRAYFDREAAERKLKEIMDRRRTQ